MAIKKFLMENGKQVWPITRADCVYNVAGDKLLSAVVDEEIARAKAAEKANADAIAQEIEDREAAIEDLQGQIDAIVGDGEGSIVDQINAAKEELQGNIDTLEGVVEDNKEACENAMAQEVIDRNAAIKVVDDAFKEFKTAQEQKNNALDQKDNDLAKAIEDEAAARLEKDNNLEGRVAANEAFVAAQPAIDAEQDRRLGVLEAKFGDGEGTVEDMIADVQGALNDFMDQAEEDHGNMNDAIEAAQGAADKAQEEVDALEEFVGHKAQGTDAASGLCFDIAKNAQDIAKEIQDRKDADDAVRGEFAAKDAEMLAAAKAYADEKDTADKNAQVLVDQEQDRRLGELEAKFDGDNSVDNKIAAVQGALDQFKLDQDARDDEQEQALIDEATAREEADNALDGRLDVIEGEGEGSVKKALQDAKDYADEKDSAMQEEINNAFTAMNNAITGEAERADAAEKALGLRIDGEKEAREAKDNELNQAILDEKTRAEGKEGELLAAIEAEAKRADAAEKVNAKAIADEKTRAEGKEQELLNAINKEIEDRENADEQVLEDAKGYVDEKVQEINGAAEDLEERVAANEAKLAGLEKETVQASIDQAEADAKKYADDAITALVDSAPDAMNTLNELAKAINDNKGVYDAYVEEHATAMANMKKDLQDEIDSDVAAEADLRVAADNKIREDFAAADTALHTTISAEIDADVKVEADRAKEAEKALDDKINAIFAAYDGDQEYDDLKPLA